MPDLLVYHLDTLPPETGHPALLDAAEREAFAKRGMPYLLERCLLKREIARRLGMEAGDVRFTYNANGKPLHPGIHFNISHSGGLLCLAFHHAPVGVDIERIRPRRNLEALAERIMCPEQLEAFRSRGCPEGEFFSCWCAAEALVKHAGSTVWHARSFPFLYREGRIPPLAEGMPQVDIFTPAEGFAGAVAYEAPTQGVTPVYK